MRFNSYAGARQGILGGLNNIMGAGQYAQGGYNDTLRTLAAVDLGRTGADKHRVETSILNDQLDARGGIPAALAGLKLPDGVNTDTLSAVLRARKDPSLKDLFGGLGNAQNTNTQRRAVDAALGENGMVQNTETANLLNTIAKPGEAYMPYRGGDYGTTNQSTGAHAPNASNLALATDRTASAGAHEAASRNYDASAREHDAGARAKGVVKLAPGASAFSVADLLHGIGAPGAQPAAPAIDTMGMENVPGVGAQTGGTVADALQAMTAPGAAAPLATGPAPLATAPGSDKPSAAAKKHDEMLALGVPPEVARGVAYGTFKQVMDSRGQMALVDISSGSVVGHIGRDQNTGAAIWVPSQAAPGASAPGNPQDPLGIR